MNDIEREAIILNSAWEMIDGMVNWAMFDKNDYTRPTNLLFSTSEHRRLFAILLNDSLYNQRVQGWFCATWVKSGATQCTTFRFNLPFSPTASLP